MRFSYSGGASGEDGCGVGADSLKRSVQRQRRVLKPRTLAPINPARCCRWMTRRLIACDTMVFSCLRLALGYMQQVVVSACV